MSVYAGPEISNDNLFLHLDASNKRSYPGSGTTWFDLSGNTNNATMFNSPTNNGQTFTFNGASSQYMTIPYKSEWRLISSTTISFWSNGNPQTGNAISYQKGGWEGYLITESTPTYSAVVGANDTGTGFTKSNNNEWCLFTWVIDRAAGFYYVYKNDTLQYSKAITHSDLSSLFSSGSLFIGGNTNGAPSRFYTGSIASISFYTRALSLAEIGRSFNALRGRFGI